MSSVSSSCSSSSLVSSSFWLRCWLGDVIWSCVVGWVVGRAGCLSPLLLESLSIASHFKPSSAVVSHAMSLETSLLSLLDLSGCK